MNVMVTGCAGFIGSHVVESLLNSGISVVGVDSLTYAGKYSNMESFLDSIQFFELDICNTQAIQNIVKKSDVGWIINLAAETHVDNSIKSCESFIHSNINGVRSLLDVCNQTGCKLLQVSTDEVYGSCPGQSFDEESSFAPGNPYSATKTAAEHMIFSYHNTYGTTFRTVRMSNNFGPRQHKEKLIPTILRKIKSGEKIPIYGDGKNIRDWFYVKDCANMVKSVLLNGSDNEVYNLTFSNEKQNLEIVNMILEKLNLKFNECAEFVTDRPGHDFRYSICNKKIMEIVNHSPTDFNEAIQETIDFYLGEKSE